ncbi:HEPN family nuclease [Bergeyella porcorum]|uniref:HEPN family nuclease n=1 Tax=Bergeyella porcorum TaxID=1735111 RepID=UPI0035E72E97
MITKEYPIEFVERTLLLVNNSFEEMKLKKLEVTFLLNCLLGLIIATNENIENEEYFSKTKLLNEEIIPFIPKTIAILNINAMNKKIKEEINKKSLINQLDSVLKIQNTLNIDKFEQIKNLTLKQFIRFLRNGIAHQNLMATSDNEHWKGIRIWNHNSAGIKDFEVEFTTSELKKFAIFIGEKFIQNYQK